MCVCVCVVHIEKEKNILYNMWHIYIHRTEEMKIMFWKCELMARVYKKIEIIYQILFILFYPQHIKRESWTFNHADHNIHIYTYNFSLSFCCACVCVSMCIEHRKKRVQSIYLYGEREREKMYILTSSIFYKLIYSAEFAY